MAARILVAYASKKGSTADIARAIARELGNAGFVVDVTRMEDVSSLEPYDALVLGTPVYAGKFLADIPAFVRRNSERIARIPIAGFITGIAPVFPEAGDPDAIAEKLVQAMGPGKPVAVTMFAGKFESREHGILVRSLGKVMKIPEGDFRDWNAISAWARGLPEKMGF